MAEPTLPRDAVGCHATAEAIGLALPDACVDGVLINLAVLDGHLTIVRAALRDPDSSE